MSKDLFRERIHRLGCMKIYLHLTRLCDVRVKLLRERDRQTDRQRQRGRQRIVNGSFESKVI